MGQKRTLDISDEERERRRERALALKEEGKIGPQFGKLGGRPRKPRATEKVAEEAQKEADKIISVFKDGIDPKNKMHLRLAAANSWLAIEQEEAKLKMQEEKHEIDIESASRDELIGFLANALTQGTIAEQIGPIIDGTAEDISDAELAGTESPEGDGSSG